MIAKAATSLSVGAPPFRVVGPPAVLFTTTGVVSSVSQVWIESRIALS